ncbi:MAG: DUF1854 domain-containing protein [Longimicrobiales bacterium]
MENNSVSGSTPSTRLWRGKDEQLWASKGDNEEMVKVQRCFPWSDPGRFVSLRDEEDVEFAYVSDVAALDPDSRKALEGAMAEAGFLLEVTAVHEVAEEIEIRSWSVSTAQGERTFQTRLDDWPLQTPNGGILIRDVSGDLYHVPSINGLDEGSRGLLWAYAG